MALGYNLIPIMPIILKAEQRCPELFESGIDRKHVLQHQKQSLHINQPTEAFVKNNAERKSRSSLIRSVQPHLMQCLSAWMQSVSPVCCSCLYCSSLQTWNLSLESLSNSEIIFLRIRFLCNLRKMLLFLEYSLNSKMSYLEIENVLQAKFAILWKHD